MSELDNKLREISLYPDKYYDTFSLSDEDIAQIKQAFADAGYRYWDGQQIWMSREQLEQQMKSPVMTGAEWYERYCAETSQIYLEDSDDVDTYVYMCDQAARKAAGL